MPGRVLSISDGDTPSPTPPQGEGKIASNTSPALTLPLKGEGDPK